MLRQQIRRVFGPVTHGPVHAGDCGFEPCHPRYDVFLKAVSLVADASLAVAEVWRFDGEFRQMESSSVWRTTERKGPPR